MPKLTTQPPEHSPEYIKKRNQIIAEIVFLAASAVGILYLLFRNLSVIGVGGVAVIALFIILRYVPGIFKETVERKRTEDKQAVQGAIAEARVSEILAKLPADYYVLNAIHSPFGNIDAVVIGKKAGIFIIEAKSQAGTVHVEDDLLLVNDKPVEKNLVPNVLLKASWLAGLVSQIVGDKPWVTPVLVFYGAKVVPGRAVKGITIVSPKTLRTVLERMNKPSPLNLQVWKQREVIEARLAR